MQRASLLSRTYHPMDGHLDPGPPATSTLDALLRWMRALDTAGVDATLEWSTHRLAAASASAILLGIGSMNQKRFVVGASLVTGSALIFLRAAATDSVCACIDQFAYVVILPTATQSAMIVYRIHNEEDVSPGNWAYFAGLIAMMTAWSAGSVVCDSSWLMLSFCGFILSSVLLLLLPADEFTAIFVIMAIICYGLSFSTMYLIATEAAPALA